MFQAKVIGHIGNDAEVKSNNGKEFTTFRVAHTDKWTDEQGNTKEQTTWVDCVINGKSAVVEYLKKGTCVFCEGNANLRIYSSAKDRCMKAGITINVRSIELVGAKPDAVPSVLYRADDGTQVVVNKFYHNADLVRGEDKQEYIALVSKNQSQFFADRQGFIYPFTAQNTEQ